MSSEYEDRRASKRYPDEFLILVMNERGEEGEPCRLVDVSTGGMGVQAPKALELSKDSTLLVEIPLGRSLSRIRTRCQVRGISNPTPEVIHLEFVDSSDLFQKIIQESIEIWNHRHELESEGF